jgi:hypothetical protein
VGGSCFSEMRSCMTPFNALKKPGECEPQVPFPKLLYAYVWTYTVEMNHFSHAVSRSVSQIRWLFRYPEGYYRVHKIKPLTTSTGSCTKSTSTLDSFKIHFNAIYVWVSQVISSPRYFRLKCISHIQRAICMFRPSHPPWPDKINNTRRPLEATNPTLCPFIKIMSSTCKL